MAEKIALMAQTRGVSGSSAARKVRRTGMIPAILYNDRCETRSLQLNAHDFQLMLGHHTSEALVADLTVDQEAPRKVLLREIQHDGITGAVIHVDFLEVSMTRVMRVRVPIRLMGEPVGVTQGGGILDQHVRDVEVECLPGDIVEFINVDVTGLNLGQTMQVKDIPAVPGLTVLTAGDIAVAGVLAPHAETEEKAAEEEGAAAPAEPEVIGAKKKEEAEEAGEEKKDEKKESKKEEKKK
jgi:large subunit ribosomal protein L25